MAKNRVYSVLTALPPLMLMIGLFVYYRAEQAQREGPLILQEGLSWVGSYKGTSALKSLGEEQLIFWLDTDERSRGARISAAQMQQLDSLQPPLQAGDRLTLSVAPRVAGSTTYWLVSIEHAGELLLD